MRCSASGVAGWSIPTVAQLLLLLNIENTEQRSDCNAGAPGYERKSWAGMGDGALWLAGRVSRALGI